jgi:hypothetical protein
MKMAEPDKHTALVYGVGFERCELTGRPFERGSGALSRAEQQANFVRDAARVADVPKMGERDLQTGREFDCSVGALPKSIQSQQFLSELSPADRRQRQAAANALLAIAPAGTA